MIFSCFYEPLREAEEREKAAAATAAQAASRLSLGDPSPWRHKPLRENLPEVNDTTNESLQCNEGDWEFSLEEDNEFSVLLLTVKLESYLDIHSVQLRVLPSLVQLLARGRLLQVRLPVEVRSDAAVAERSKASGRLVVKMPMADGKLLFKRPKIVGLQPKNELKMGEKSTVNVLLTLTAENAGLVAAAVAAEDVRGAGGGGEGDEEEDHLPPL